MTKSIKKTPGAASLMKVNKPVTVMKEKSSVFYRVGEYNLSPEQASVLRELGAFEEEEPIITEPPPPPDTKEIPADGPEKE